MNTSVNVRLCVYCVYVCVLNMMVFVRDPVQFIARVCLYGTFFRTMTTIRNDIDLVDV